jgi:hypothetical protein
MRALHAIALWPLRAAGPRMLRRTHDGRLTLLLFGLRQLGSTPRGPPAARLHPRFAQRSGQRQGQRSLWWRRQPSTRRLTKIRRQ